MSKRPIQPRLASRSICLRAAVVCCFSIVLALATPTGAQTKITRKLVYKENPGYPLTLREARIGGVVRLEILISAKGGVETVTPLGGNPVLVEAASVAVRKWKYVPTDTETKTQVEFTFDPKH